MTNCCISVSGIHVVPKRTEISAALKSSGMTCFKASAFKEKAGSDFAAISAIFSFSRTSPDRYSSAVTYLAGSEFGTRKITPLSSSAISSCGLPVSCAIYGKSTRAFSPIDNARASLAVSTEVTSRWGFIVRLENISAFRLKFPSSSSTSKEHKRK